MNPRWILEAAGISLMMSLLFFVALIYPGNLSLYHHRLQFGHLIGGILLAMFAVFLFALVLIVYIRYRFPPRARDVLGAFFAGLILLHATDDLLYLLKQSHSALDPTSGGTPSASHIAALASLFWYSPLFRLLVVAVLGAIAWRRPTWTHPIVEGARVLMAGLAFSLIWIVPSLTLLALGRQPIEDFDHSASAHHEEPHPRIVWILFDELSQDLVFDDPPSGMQLPNLQKMRSSSVSLENIAPLGFYTDRILPSLLAGKVIVKMRSDSQGKLSYFDKGQSRWVALMPPATIFGLAQSSGWNSGVVGWYNPYCRSLAPVLTACAWEPGLMAALPLEVLGASEEKSVLANALIAIRAFLTEPIPSNQDRREPRIHHFSNLMQQTRNMIQNRTIDFVFVHLPVPHPPGFYNRTTHELCACGNYLDNLVLADQTLAQLMQEINKTPWANQTTVIVSSDHSWRTPLWNESPDWTPEEEEVSKGEFDPRPVFLVHFPGQTTSYQVRRPAPELIENDIVVSLLKDKVTTPQNLLELLHLETPPR